MNNKLFIQISGFSLFLICALRDVNFGDDGVRYMQKYLYFSNVNISVLWTDFLTFEVKDPFFNLFSKIISILGFSYQFWFAIIAAIFCTAVSTTIYKYSSSIIISFIALISLGYLYFSMTGLRQTIALSMILISYKFLRERKLVVFIIIVVFGALFHSSALIFLLAYPFAYMKIGWKQILSVGSSLVMAFLFSNQLRQLIRVIGWNKYLSYYADRDIKLTISGFIIQLLIISFCLFYKKGVLFEDKKNISLYNLLFIGLIFQSFAIVVAETFRISMYFSIFSIILIPKTLAVKKDKIITLILYLVVSSALIAYILWSGLLFGFKFFWQ
ncbi:MAG: EpsG family protein [Bacteroidetes bacterium]|nr:EpsG family protein [Bacteroidota bacterium]